MREFRVHYAELQEVGVEVAGVSTDTPESSVEWARRLSLPYPLLSDVERRAGSAFGVIRRIGVGSWNVEFFRRTTFLVDANGIVVAMWQKVKIRGHALEVRDMARALASTA
jgi:thioredoxin-dependent peroxiredoxin